MMSELTHFNDQGRAHMVDVTDKSETQRTATAKSSITINQEIYQQIKDGTNKKGDVLAVAQIAAVMAAKNTSQIIPMCHPLLLSGVNAAFDWVIDEENHHYQIDVLVTVKVTGPTGVEMEALTAASAAALTIYDMCKAAGKDMVIGPTLLLSKTGGKSGDYTRDC